LPKPSRSATTADAAVSDGYPPMRWLNSRTARAVSSGSISFGMVLILLDSNRSGINPGALHLAAHREEVFPDAMFADLFPSGRGRPSVPASVVATVLVLQALHGLSDRRPARL